MLLGIDIGTTSVKVSVVDPETQVCIASTQYPDVESSIKSIEAGWAEQSPEMWWQHTLQAIKKLNQLNKFDAKQIVAIGIAYQMHGLVLVDKEQNVLRDSIIWCDSRAVEIGEAALNEIGESTCSSCLLNSPGNFTGSKLAWVKKNEPEIYTQVYNMMLPGDFIAMKLTGEITTSSSAMSEGILWDFKTDDLSKDVIKYFDFDENLFPKIQPVFSEHGYLLSKVATQLGLKENIPVTYKSGDQLNNALSLNVLQPGEVAATAGTSGVIYAVTDKLLFDKFSRVNTFAHVNHKTSAGKNNEGDDVRLGVLLCINGTGIMNSWIKTLSGNNLSYHELNELAKNIPPGCEGLSVLPFGNGAERMLQNKTVGAYINNIDLNKHSSAHIFRAVQEGIAFAFRFGLDIMRENGLHPTVIRAGRANLFLSDVFVQSFVNATGVAVELYKNDGSAGAALGAGIGAGIYKNYEEAFSNFKPLYTVKPDNTSLYKGLYLNWKEILNKHLE